MWALYGVLIGSAPVVASNVLVLAAAAWTTARAGDGVARNFSSASTFR
jgi:hypothetical protein